MRLADLKEIHSVGSWGSRWVCKRVDRLVEKMERKSVDLLENYSAGLWVP